MSTAKNKRLWWDAKHCRWQCRYLGKSYSVSCRQLGVHPTKYASEQPAHAWWKAKKQEIDAEQAKSLGLHDAVLHARTQHAACLRIGNETAARYWGRFSARLSALLASGVVPSGVEFDSETGRFATPTESASEIVNQAIAKLAAILREDQSAAIAACGKLNLEVPVEVPELTSDFGDVLTTHLAIERFLERKKRDGVTNQRFDDVRRLISVFGKHAAGKACEINEATISTFPAFVDDIGKQDYQRGRRKAWSQNYKRHILHTARQFIQWCFRQSYIDKLPRNLDELRLRAQIHEVQTYSAEEVSMILNAADESCKLFVLLTLNIGATQKDIGDLEHSEVDWREGRITRRRSKMQDHQSAQTVSYMLWPETFRLLKKLRSKHELLVLLNEDGLPLWHDRFDGEKYRKCDAVRYQFDRVRKKLGIVKTLKHFRKTGASMLASHFGEEMAQYYLAHSPRSIAQRHYLKIDQAKFDDAVTWLGRELKIVSD